MDARWDVVTGSLLLVVSLALGGVALLVLCWVVVAAVIIMKRLWKRRRPRRAPTGSPQIDRCHRRRPVGLSAGGAVYVPGRVRSPGDFDGVALAVGRRRRELGLREGHAAAVAAAR